jgi:hypothetical protein
MSIIYARNSTWTMTTKAIMAQVLLLPVGAMIRAATAKGQWREFMIIMIQMSIKTLGLQSMLFVALRTPTQAMRVGLLHVTLYVLTTSAVLPLTIARAIAGVRRARQFAMPIRDAPC